MTIGDKLCKLRRENNYTQEQLADILGVSRQAVSKWESNTAYPETDKLIHISELFDCSVDYLLKDTLTQDEKSEEPMQNGIFLHLPKVFRERKSQKTLWGRPLWHIGKNAKGFLAIGMNACGVIAIGLKARGIISVGLLSIGVISFGGLSLGLLSFGLFALGIMSAGCFAAGVFAAGAISFGIISAGAIAIGDFSFGALAIGKYVAVGDNARAAIALGDTHAFGSVYQKIGALSSSETMYVKNLMDEYVPSYLSWAKEIIKHFI